MELGLICVVRRRGIESVAPLQEKSLFSSLVVAIPAYSLPCGSELLNLKWIFCFSVVGHITAVKLPWEQAVPVFPSLMGN